MTRKILVATDGSNTANRAVDLAAELSGRFEQDLCIVHVHLHGRPPKEILRLAEIEDLAAHYSSGGLTQTVRLPVYVRDYLPKAEDELEWARTTVAIGEQILERAKERAEERGARNVTTEIRAGDYADEILELAESEGLSMIVMGCRGLGRVREALLGSVSQKVLHHAPCTVVIAR